MGFWIDPHHHSSILITTTCSCLVIISSGPPIPVSKTITNNVQMRRQSHHIVQLEIMNSLIVLNTPNSLIQHQVTHYYHHQFTIDCTQWFFSWQDSLRTASVMWDLKSFENSTLGNLSWFWPIHKLITERYGTQPNSVLIHEYLTSICEGRVIETFLGLLFYPTLSITYSKIEISACLGLICIMNTFQIF